MKDRIISVLKEATQGLLFPSETDAPFEPFVWEAAENSAASVIRFSGEGPEISCSTQTLQEFFNVLNQEKPFPLKKYLNTASSARTIPSWAKLALNNHSTDGATIGSREKSSISLPASGYWKSFLLPARRLLI